MAACLSILCRQLGTGDIERSASRLCLVGNCRRRSAAGFLMSSMFFSNMLHWKTAEYPKTYEDTTVIICAHNEEDSVARSIKSVLLQRYSGSISVLVVDNASSDLTRQEIFRMMPHAGTNRSVRYLFCAEPGKARALNTGLAHVHTTHFITLDADTCLERDAVQRIMDHIVHSRKRLCCRKSVCQQCTRLNVRKNAELRLPTEHFRRQAFSGQL